MGRVARFKDHKWYEGKEPFDWGALLGISKEEAEARKEERKRERARAKAKRKRGRRQQKQRESWQRAPETIDISDGDQEKARWSDDSGARSEQDKPYKEPIAALDPPQKKSGD